MIKVVNKHFYKGPGEYVGRPSPLGNKWSHLGTSTLAEYRVTTLQEALDKYREWLPGALQDDPVVRETFDNLVQKYLDEDELTLICWCAPNPCHADIIKEFIERRIKILMGRA